MPKVVLPAPAGASDLAESGGAPVRRAPFPPWPAFDREMLDASSRVLSSGRVNYLTGGEGLEFEREIARLAGTRHAVALANGTLAIEAALRAMGVGPGDEVITTSRTFVASASAALWLGATPIFADVDPDSGNLTAESIRPLLTPRTKAIVAVHLGGWPCDMDPILALARERGVKVIEDCAQATGAIYHGRPIGSLGDVAAWSFCQDKIITTAGEGGAVTTDDTALRDRIWSMKDHGKDHAAFHQPSRETGFRWLHETVGTNWRLSEVQAAVGRVQLARLPGWLAARREWASRLSDAFREEPALRVAAPPPGVEHTYYRYYAYLRPELLLEGWTRDRIVAAVVAEGVPCFSGSCSEIYLEGCFTQAGVAPATPRPVARELGDTSLAFLVHPTLTAGDVTDTIAAVRKVLAAACASPNRS